MNIDSYPLTHGQKALWFQSRLIPESSAYNIIYSAYIKPDTDPKLLQAALDCMKMRHPILTATIVTEGDEPVHRIHKGMTFHLNVVDASGWGREKLERWISEEADSPFDLEKGPLIRASLVENPPHAEKGKKIFLFTVHHIIFDFWSLEVFLKDLSSIYGNLERGEEPMPVPLETDYKDYVRWYHELLSGSKEKEFWTYWREQLSGELPVLNLPTDRPRPTLQTYHGASLTFAMDREQCLKVRDLVRETGTSVHTILLSVFQILLSRYTGQEALLIGTPMTTRERSLCDGLIGYFVNPVIIRADLSGNPGFKELVKRVRRTILSGIGHRYFPFSMIVERLQQGRNSDRSPIFQVFFCLNKEKEDGVWNLYAKDRNPLIESIFMMGQRETVFDLTLLVFDTSTSLNLEWTYNVDLFDESTIRRMSNNFFTLLGGIIDTPDKPVGRLPILTDTEKERILKSFNKTDRAYPEQKSIHRLFEEWVEKQPDKTALFFGSETMTYRELNNKANRLAKRLMEAGVRTEAIVGICVERSMEMIIGLLGILKAGGGYLPIDPNYPEDRIAFMLEDSGIEILLTQERLVSALPALRQDRYTIIRIDGDWLDSTKEGEEENPISDVRPDNIAYMMYTSGSTGVPKGVIIVHKGVVRLVKETNIADFSPEDVHIQSSSISFDPSTLEIWGVLLNGGSLAILPPGKPSLEALGKTIRRYRVTHFFTTPAVFQLFVDERIDDLRHLRLIAVGGEVFSPAKANRFLEKVKGCRIFNAYGPTENTTLTTFYPVTYPAPASVPIGKPISHTGVYILDQHLNPVPIGVIGELYTWGDGLARGYHNRPELTAEKFIPNPFADKDGALMYRTGDLARYREDGNIEFIGRIDNQVKIRGFRVEIGEVESVLMQIQGISDAVVIARKDRQVSQYLAAYIIPVTGMTLDVSKIKEYLNKKLPDYAVPTAFSVMDAFPLLPTEKVDLKALPEPVLGERAGKYEGPENPAEAQLCAIWMDVLKHPRIGVQDNFFELGGHSLLATLIISRIKSTMGVELPIRALFETPTIRGLSRAIEGLSYEKSTTPPPSEITPLPAGTEPVLSFGQERLWFLDQLGEGGFSYNAPLAIALKGDLNIPAMEDALNEILKRHDVLRAVFKREEGKPVEIIREEVKFSLPITDLPGRDGLSAVNREAWQPFDLSAGPLFRATLYRISPLEHILLIVIHHIVADGWSMGILIKELNELYSAIIKDKPSPLKDLSIQYPDFARWQKEQLKGNRLQGLLRYWTSQLEGAPDLLELPTDKPRPPVQTYNGGMERFEMDHDLTAGLQRLAGERGASLFMVLHAAFSLLLFRYSGQRDILIGVPAANRHHRQIEPLIGFFVNTLVLRTKLSEEAGFTELIDRVKDATLDGYAHQDLPFEQLVEHLQIKRSTAHSPLFQVMFSLEEYPTGNDLSLPGLETVPLELDNIVAKFDLTLTLTKAPDGLKGEFEYNRDLFNRDRIRRMIGHLKTLLGAVIAHPHQPISALPLLTETERHRIVVEWNNRTTDSPEVGFIHRLFEHRAEKDPDAPALIFEDRHLTYGELNNRSNQLARYLRDLGVRPEIPVGVCMERSMEMIVGLLAILKSGGTYVPLDPAYPEERLRWMFADSGINGLITGGNRMPPPARASVTVIDLDREWEEIGKRKIENLHTNLSPDHPAYIIYTSGTTGKPKGVEITHGSIARHARSARRYYHLTPEDRVLQFSSLTVDTSLEQILPTLISGAALALRGRTIWTIGDFTRHAMNRGLTVADLPPSYLLQILRAWARDPELLKGNKLRLIICGGEPMPVEILELWQNIPGKGIVLINAYGPTEATITATAYEIQGKYAEIQGDTFARTVPIGRPLENRRVFILDECGNPVPVGVPGELHIGGDCLARGYHKRPELTKERFIPDPFADGSGLLYKTGDIAAYLPDGNITFIGRRDDQVKIRGFRVEPAEVEAVLEEHASVSRCAVSAREDKGGNRYLAAHIIPAREGALPESELKAYLKARLPDHMIPAAFVEISSFPLTPAGKIDRKALPDPEVGRSSREVPYTEPQTGIERKIARAWQDALSTENVGIHDNFFDIGGNSLLVIQVQNELEKLLNRPLPIITLFQYPTIHTLAEHLTQGGPEPSGASIPAHKPRYPESRTGTDVAVIGMACRFPGAKDTDQFWKNLCDGVESIRFFSDAELLSEGVDPALLNHPDYVKAGGIIEGAGRFDAPFFGYTPKEAEPMDPQQRLFLECSWEAVENAGYDVGRIDVPVGVFAGVGMNTYLLQNLYPHYGSEGAATDYLLGINSDKDFLSTRVSYKLNLKGPAVNIQTACSTSLVAVHTACKALENNDCAMALAGGVTVHARQNQGYLYEEGMIMSPDGHCRAFDAEARGTVGGNGVGIVVLKRLEMALAAGDTIYAVIRGSAVNNDGAVKVGYTAPGLEGQSQVISEAIDRAGIDVETITYVETHGTATQMGDPIEVAALTKAFRRRTEKKGFCAVGSVKTNIGHLDTAAGVASLIKTVLSLKNGMIPPSLNFKTSNPEIDFENSPFYVNQTLTRWDTGESPRRAGVSSFGIGGTNAHVILEQPPPESPAGESLPRHLILLSAKTQSALNRATANLAGYFKDHPDNSAADAAYTLSTGRKAFQHRRMLVCSGLKEAAEALDTQDPRRLLAGTTGTWEREMVFMFSGQASQYVDMARGLYSQVPPFRETVDRCCETLKAHRYPDLRRILYPQSEKTAGFARELEQTALTQPALFVIEYALAKLWISWGVKPSMMIGHSVGEYTAACLSGVISLQDALAVVTQRGRLMQEAPEGAMLSVPLSESEIAPFLNSEVSLAAHNAPSRCVLSGATSAIDRIQEALEVRDIPAIRLNTRHAFHSEMMDSIQDAFEKEMRKVTLNPPEIPYISNVTGRPVTGEEAIDPGYWATHMRQTVRFSEGLQTLLTGPERIFLEIGPGRSLASLAREHTKKTDNQLILNSIRHPKEHEDDLAFLLTSLGRLWLAGVEIDWPAFYKGQKRRRIPLPFYPFEGAHYWVSPLKKKEPAAAESMDKRPDIADWFYRPVWRPVSPPEKTAESAWPPMCWLVFEDTVGLGVELGKRIASMSGQRVITIGTGPAFQHAGAGRYILNPDRVDDYHSLIRELEKGNLRPQRILHLWNVTGKCGDGPNPESMENALSMGFYSLLNLAQALQDRTDELELTVLSNHMHALSEREIQSPEKAVLLGPVRVIGQEFPNIRCRAIDLSFQPPEAGIEPGNHPEIVDQLIRDLSDPIPDPVTARRGAYLWRQDYEPVRLGPVPESAGLREKGVYLITGGLGGIGLTLAEHLARTVRARLVLIGQSEFPDEADWDRWLNAHGKADRVSRRIVRLRALKALGAELLILTADVCDRVKMEGAVTTTIQRFGAVNGVIHAAGMPDGALIVRQQKGMAGAVIGPKVKGALILDHLFREKTPDFVVLCSSLTAVTGEPGQIAYTSANAFLDAFSHFRTSRRGSPTMSVNWDTWQEVGMAAESIARYGKGKTGAGDERSLSHSLFDALAGGQDNREVRYISRLNEDRWFLNEHRIMGKTIFPGTALLELAWAAAGLYKGRQEMELRDIYFSTPLIVAETEETVVHTILEESGDNLKFRITSTLASGVPQEHVRGIIRSVSSPANRYDLKAIEGLCREKKIDLNKDNSGGPINLEAHIKSTYGPRWQNLQKIHVGNRSGLAMIELPSEFSRDLEQHPLHPALLDVAAGFLSIHDRIDGFPFSYDRVTIRVPLPARFYSYARYSDHPSDMETAPSFNVTLMDEEGMELMDIEGYTFRKGPFLPDRTDPNTEPDHGSAREKAHQEFLLKELKSGILPAEGADIFKRILGASLPRMIVSTRDLHSVLEKKKKTPFMGVTNSPETDNTPKKRYDRPQLSSEYAEPSEELEQQMAAIWQDFFGIEPIGIHDDFFELGGDSLLSIQLVSVIMDRLKIKLSAHVLLNSPNIAALVRQIKGTSDDPRGTKSLPLPPNVIPIQRGRKNNPILFLIHPVGGTVYFYRHLAQTLDADLTCCGIQSLGLNGGESPLTGIEEMAEKYIEAVDLLQPEGPYYIGGASMGGLVALEMARRYRDRNREIALLFMIDTAVPGRGEPPSEDEVEEILSYLIHLGVDPSVITVAELRDLNPRERLLYCLDRGKRAHWMPPNWGLEQFRISFHIFKANSRAMWHYTPQPYPGGTLFFHASERNLPDTMKFEKGWRTVIKGPMETVKVPGNHFTMNFPPNVQVIGERLMKFLSSNLGI